MNEITLQWVQLIKLLIIAVCATMYGFGGVVNKGIRRIGAPIVLTAGIVGISLWTTGEFTWLYLLYAPSLFGAYSTGYGGTSDTKVKILKRSRYGALTGIAAVWIAIPNATWLLLCLHIFLCVLVSVILGVWNPTKSARAEETAIGFTTMLIPFVGMV